VNELYETLSKQEYREWKRFAMRHISTIYGLVPKDEDDEPEENDEEKEHDDYIEKLLAHNAQNTSV